MLLIISSPNLLRNVRAIPLLMSRCWLPKALPILINTLLLPAGNYLMTCLFNSFIAKNLADFQASTHVKTTPIKIAVTFRRLLRLISYGHEIVMTGIATKKYSHEIFENPGHKPVYFSNYVCGIGSNQNSAAKVRY